LMDEIAKIVLDDKNQEFFVVCRKCGKYIAFLPLIEKPYISSICESCINKDY